MTSDPALHAARRARVFQAMEAAGGGVLLVAAADEKLRNNDATYPFRQDSDFYWLTGFDEPQGCVVLDGRKGERKVTMFVRPRDKEKEIWDGIRLGVDGAKAVLGADEAWPVAEQDGRLGGLLDGARTLWFRLGADAGWD